MSDIEHEHHSAFGDCDDCRSMWMREAGSTPGVCMVCDHRHWPWDAHNTGPLDLGPCELCGETIGADDNVTRSRTLDGFGGSRDVLMHAECQALPIVGHMFGICSCTGYGTDRSAAKELWERMRAGSREFRNGDDR